MGDLKIVDLMINNLRHKSKFICLSCLPPEQLPEICGNAAIYCDPYDIKSIMKAILKMADQSIARNVIKNRFVEITSKQQYDLDKLVNTIIS